MVKAVDHAPQMVYNGGKTQPLQMVTPVVQITGLLFKSEWGGGGGGAFSLLLYISQVPKKLFSYIRGLT